MDVAVASKAPVVSREKKHGGGWPKGKSRKKATELLLPKPPVSGYCSEQLKCIYPVSL